MNRRQFVCYVPTAGAGILLRSACAASDRQPDLKPKPQDEPIEVALAGSPDGPWRRLFLDGAAVETSSGLTRRFHSPQKLTTAPVLRQDRPWEGSAAIIGPYIYGTVFREGERLRMWYQLLCRGNHVGYAESSDGVNWSKPSLGIIEYEGSKANNLVVSAYDPAATGGGQCHNPSVIRCPPNSDPEKRYALYGFDSKAGHARVAFSRDGLHWNYVAETAVQPLFGSSDVVNFCYDPYQSRYFATWKTRNRRGRAVGIVWSNDGLSWTKPWDGPIFTADDWDPDATQIYGMPVFPYQGMYIGLPWIYSARYFRYGQYSVARLHEAQEDSPRTMDVQMAWSWDLVNWTRPKEREQFIRRGGVGEWDAGMIVTARAPVIVDDKLYFYYGGTDGVHDQPRVRAGIGVAALRLDGFCSMHCQQEEGFLISRREPFQEPAVTINARTFDEGVIVAEILDRHNNVVPGFRRTDCQPFRGNSVRHELRWKSDRLPMSSATTDFKIRFILRNAELFSYLPHGLDPAQKDLARFQKLGP